MGKIFLIYKTSCDKNRSSFNNIDYDQSHKEITAIIAHRLIFTFFPYLIVYGERIVFVQIFEFDVCVCVCQCVCVGCVQD
jgi:hypothetical protein